MGEAAAGQSVALGSTTASRRDVTEVETNLSHAPKSGDRRQRPGRPTRLEAGSVTRTATLTKLEEIVK
jgi:hypothetical protein